MRNPSAISFWDTASTCFGLKMNPLNMMWSEMLRGVSPKGLLGLVMGIGVVVLGVVLVV